MRNITALLMFIAGVFALSDWVYGAEGRIPIFESTTIAVSGSYIVTEDISTSTGHAIVIQANDVSIDLDGHTVATLQAGYYGIYSSGYTNIHIANGAVRGGSGGVYLVQLDGNFHVEHLRVTGGGNAPTGILVAGDVTSPSGSTTSAYAVVEHNIVTGAGGVFGGYGIRFFDAKGTIENNKVSKWQNGIYLEASTNLFVEKNIAAKNTEYGIKLFNACNNNMIRNNSVSENTLFGIGIYNSDYNTVTSNTASRNGTCGIEIGEAPAYLSYNNDIRGNTTACQAGQGIRINGCGNIYSDNKAPGGCTIFVEVAACTTPNPVNPNIDGGGNTP